MFERFENASGFIFDCDGCLLDSMPTWRGVENKLIEMTGHDWTQAEIEEMRAAPMPVAARLFHERFGLFSSEQDVVDFVDATMLRYYNADATPRAGAKEFLFKLHSMGIPCCVVSSSPYEYVEAGLRTCDMHDTIDTIFSTKEVGISKQDPRIWRMACEQMGARVASTWGADDSIYAIRVLNDCGISSIGTYDGDDSGSFDDLSKTATLTIRSFTELLN
jgi:HAD superfamily hydrolase (TIGR01509 family)